MNDCNKDKQLEGELCERPSTDLLPDYYAMVKSSVDIIEVWYPVLDTIFDNVADNSVWNITSRFLSRAHEY